MRELSSKVLPTYRCHVHRIVRPRAGGLQGDANGYQARKLSESKVRTCLSAHQRDRIGRTLSLFACTGDQGVGRSSGQILGTHEITTQLRSKERHDSYSISTRA